MKATLIASAIVASLTTSLAYADDPNDHVIGNDLSEGIAVSDSSVITQSGADGDFITSDTGLAILRELQRIRILLESSKMHIPCNVKVKER